MYSQLVKEAVKETRYFLVVVLIFVVAFGSALYIIDRGLKRIYNASIYFDPLTLAEYPSMFGHGAFDAYFTALFGQFLLMLGDYDQVHNENI